MAFRGRHLTFHGAFGTKARAEAKERTRRGSFVRRIQYRRKRKDGKRGKLQTRWVVVSQRKR